MIHAILACDSNGGIARNGAMPWPRNKTDLAHFKKLTQGSTVVMGRKTWMASDMPSPLPNRQNVVVTTDKTAVFEGADTISGSLKTLLTSLAKNSKVFVIGGAQLIEDTFDTIDIFHLTRIAGNYDCDTFISLDMISDRFELIDTVNIDNLTTFETYIAKEHYAFHPDTRI